jgi:hypothetical protein
MSGHVSNVYFGLDPMWVATCVLAITYAIIISPSWHFLGPP